MGCEALEFDFEVVMPDYGIVVLQALSRPLTARQLVAKSARPAGESTTPPRLHHHDSPCRDATPPHKISCLLTSLWTRQSSAVVNHGFYHSSLSATSELRCRLLKACSFYCDTLQQHLRTCCEINHECILQTVNPERIRARCPSCINESSGLSRWWKTGYSPPTTTYVLSCSAHPGRHPLTLK